MKENLNINTEGSVGIMPKGWEPGGVLHVDKSNISIVTVAGRKCNRSNADMEQACLVLLSEEQDKGDFSNSALVSTLADVVRLIREYSDVMNKPISGDSPDRKNL